MMRPQAPGNVRPPLTSAPAPVTVLGLWSCRALAPAALFPDAFAPPLRSSPSCSPSPWNFPSQPCPATILPTRGSLLSPRRCAAGRARPPRDRPPAVATARGDRPPRPRSFASAACVGLRRWPPRTSAASVARDPAPISRPSTAAAVAGADAHSRPASRGRRPFAGDVASSSPRPPSSPAAHPGRRAATSASFGHVCRDGPSALPPKHAEERRVGRDGCWEAARRRARIGVCERGGASNGTPRPLKNGPT